MEKNAAGLMHRIKCEWLSNCWSLPVLKQKLKSHIKKEFLGETNVLNKGKILNLKAACTVLGF